MAKNVYIVDYSRLIELSLPTFLRGNIILVWLSCLLHPVKLLYNGFVTYKNDAIYRVSHNGSVILLEKVLNDKFDPILRRIYIKNVEQQDSMRFYDVSASKEVGFYDVPVNGFRSSVGFNAENADFQVYIPQLYRSSNAVELNKFLIKVSAQVDYYKLFAKKYEIQWIN